MNCKPCDLQTKFPTGPALATIGVPSVLSAQQVSFGNWPAGCYSIAYTGSGAYFQTGGWSVNGGNNSFTIEYKCCGDYVTANFQASSTGYASQAAAEAATAGLLFITFKHSGGEILLNFSDTIYADNVNGTPNPQFALHHMNAGDWSGLDINDIGTDCSGLVINSVTFDCLNNSPMRNGLQVSVTNNSAEIQKAAVDISNPVGFNTIGSSGQFFMPPGATITVPVRILVNTLTNALSGNATLTGAAGVCAVKAFNIPSQFKLVAPTANMVRTGNAVIGTVGIRLDATNNCNLDNCTVFLNAGTGVTAPSSPVPAVAFNLGQTTNVQFSFTVTPGWTGPITANVTVRDSAGNTIANLNFTIAPILSFRWGSSAFICSGTGKSFLAFGIRNTGTVNAIAQATLKSGRCVNTNACTIPIGDCVGLTQGIAVNQTIIYTNANLVQATVGLQDTLAGITFPDLNVP